MYLSILLSALLFMAESNETARVSLLALHNKVAAGESTWIAVEIEPKEGWHTYWANPGDAGLATTVEWNLPKGISLVDSVWQVPEIIQTDEIISYGYHHKHYIFYKFTVPDNLENQIFEITGVVKWLACKEKCLPGKDTVKIQLISSNRSEINRSFSDIFGNIPVRLDNPLRGEIKDNMLEVKLSGSLNLSEKARIIPYLEGIIDNSAAQSMQGSSLVARLDAFHVEIPKEFKALIVDNEKAYDVVIFL